MAAAAAREHDAVVGVRPPRRDLPSRPLLGLDPATLRAAGLLVLSHRIAAATPRWCCGRRRLSITDYTDDLIDYLVLDRPVVAFVPDLEAFSEDPGLAARRPRPDTRAGVPRLGRTASSLPGAARGGIRGSAGPPGSGARPAARPRGRKIGRPGGPARPGDVPAGGRMVGGVATSGVTAESPDQPPAAEVVRVGEGEPHGPVVRSPATRRRAARTPCRERSAARRTSG